MTSTIYLSSGETVLLDTDWYEKLKVFKWYANRNNKSEGLYAVAKINGKKIWMHRLIMQVGYIPLRIFLPKVKKEYPSTAVVHHKDLNTLNNCKSNLEVLKSNSENLRAGKKVQKNSKTGRNRLNFVKSGKYYRFEAILKSKKKKCFSVRKYGKKEARRLAEKILDDEFNNKLSEKKVILKSV